MISKFGFNKLVKFFQKKNNETLASSDADTSYDLPAASINQTGILRKQVIRLLVILAFSIAVIVLVIIVAAKINSSNKRTWHKKEELSGDNQPMQIEIASSALDPEKMWRNHFEDKLLESNKKLDDKLSIISDSFTKKEEDLTRAAKEQLAYMQEQLNFAREELLEATGELKRAREASNNQHEKENFADVAGNWQFHKIEHDAGIEQPKSSRHFIPETAHITGILLGGISVSTGVLSAANPIPVVIRITDRGSLPKNFDIDLKTCKVMGSSRGDLSSERVEIRAEVLSCTDKESEEVTTTRIVGMIQGDDGVNGIKGKVVQTSNKQLQHAFVGGLLSGFANTAKTTPQFALTGGTAVATTQPPMGERLRDNSLAGLGNAGEKIADYYLKQAESMSPVLQVPAGSRVDIVFTKGVYLGSNDVRANLERDRRKTTKEEQQ